VRRDLLPGNLLVWQRNLLRFISISVYEWTMRTPATFVSNCLSNLFLCLSFNRKRCCASRVRPVNTLLWWIFKYIFYEKME
jgi:hypothetical protein